MAAASLTERTRALEAQVGTIIAAFDLDGLPLAVRNLLDAIKNGVSDVRLDIRDYEYAETRADQLRLVREGKQRLEQLQAQIVKASESSTFTAVDVAQLSARIQQLMSHME